MESHLYGIHKSQKNLGLRKINLPLHFFQIFFLDKAFQLRKMWRSILYECKSHYTCNIVLIPQPLSFIIFPLTLCFYFLFPVFPLHNYFLSMVSSSSFPFFSSFSPLQLNCKLYTEYLQCLHGFIFKNPLHFFLFSQWISNFKSLLFIFHKWSFLNWL